MKKLLLFSLATALAATGIAKSTYVIDGTTYDVDTLQHFKAGPGTYYSAIKFTGPQYTFRTFYLEADNTLANFEIRSELGRDSIIGTEDISAHAARKTTAEENYFAAVNGDFFLTSGEIGTPCNGSMHNGIVGTQPTGSPHIVFADAASPYISTISYSNTFAIKGEPTSLSGINCAVGANSLVLFSPTVGKFTHTPAGTTEVQLALADGYDWCVNSPMKFTVVGEPSTTGNRFVDGKAVLSGTGTMAATVAGLAIGDEVELTINDLLNHYGNIAPNIRQMVGGNLIFLANGEVVPQADLSRHPRTMIGYNKDRTKTVLAVVDGRSAISSGAICYEEAALMQYVGCDWGINIDGGGSSSVHLPQFGAMNQPSDGKERAVGNGIYCVIKAPQDDEIAEIRFKDWSMHFPKYGIYTPTFYGYNKYGIMVSKNVEGVTLSCDSKIGQIINDGTTFYGSGEGCAPLTATYNGITTTIPVDITPAEEVQYRLPAILIDNVREYPVEVQANINEEYMPLSPIALVWASADPEVAAISADGVLTGVKDGTTTINGKVGTFDSNLNVTVEIPTGATMPIVRETPAEGWTVTQTGGTGIALATEGDGFKLTYTGNGSSRGANIDMKRKVQIWSLPSKLRVRINPGEATIKEVKLQASNAMGEMVTTWSNGANTLPKNEESIIDFNLSDWCDPSDIGIYPINFIGMRMEMGASTKGTEFTVSIPGLEAVYSDAQGGVAMTAASKIKVYPNPVREGGYINVNTEEDATVEMFALNGTKVAEVESEGVCQLPTAGLSGMYIVKVATGTTVKTAKVIIK